MVDIEKDPAKPDRPTFAEYPEWLASKDAEAGAALATRSRHETVGAKIQTDVSASGAWKEILERLREFNDEYTIATGYQLLASRDTPKIYLKPYDSLLDKSYRKNVVNNKQWPEPPESGWITPANWYQLTNDIVRTTLVVKYLDGVDFLAKKLEAIAEERGHEFSVDFEARDEGYYAAHCYLCFEVEVPKLDWDTEVVRVRLEIQVTTQLQDVIRKLTHDYYERRRSLPDSRDKKWQWDYESPEFLPNYLGHILHYVEGMIMEVRKRGAAT
ncbi:hypothetical protein GA0070616_2230 [Micromonospora nigra]|uniref:RelA/SpoT domain-containing protein n=1 Tax=Micromonospora nigra TaxID=145857 RepID=A0A1C6RVE1_9ACTN|nr:hypothetical protein [Micromonospora nigra]SCL21188.1 hypothetical protein GA0070616_2230 [Micromonospora nigra]